MTNEKIITTYLTWEEATNRRSEVDIRRIKRVLDLFDFYVGDKEFIKLRGSDIASFKRELVSIFYQKNKKEPGKIAYSYILRVVRRFLIWIFAESEYQSRLLLADLEILREVG